MVAQMALPFGGQFERIRHWAGFGKFQFVPVFGVDVGDFRELVFFLKLRRIRQVKFGGGIIRLYFISKLALFR